MPCNHHHAHTTQRALVVGLVLNGGFVVVEAAAGFYAQSLALLGDAAHNLGDALGLMLAWIGVRCAARGPSDRFTFGLGRVSIFAALGNGMLLTASSAWLIVEAVQRLQQPQDCNGADGGDGGAGPCHQRRDGVGAAPRGA